MEKKKVVLAFSGGLDTSYCAKFLSQEKDFAVYSCTVNTGGFSDQELKEIERRAYKLGAVKHRCIDAAHDFYHRCIRYLIAGNILKNQTYPLCVSAERAFQAFAIAQYASEIGADAIAHGSTGAGNDQVRFDLIFRALCPDKTIMTPIRDNTLTRQQEIDYLKLHRVEWDFVQAIYSINKGLWGTSVGGKETLHSRYPLPENAYPTPMKKELTDQEMLKISFCHGEPVQLNGQKYTRPVQLIQDLQSIAQPYGIGRDIHVGDTVIGIKGRVGFEAAAPILLIKSHHLLEKHTLTSQQLKTKDLLAPIYGELIHQGLFLEPVLQDLEAYFQRSQRHVTGDVFIRLAPYRFTIEGINSSFDLMSDKFGSYGEMNISWSGEDVKGFSKIFGLQTSIYQEIEKYEKA